MIDSREEMIIALSEAAELEHGLLCQYLFAAFSMKRHPEEGISWAQVERLRTWERQILSVAREEMAHLGTVCNLLSAIGGAPHFGRPDFPQPARYFPALEGDEPVAFSLERLSETTISRFVRFESPESDLLEAAIDIAPDPLRYRTVGELYGQIKDAFQVLDEQSLFIGPQTSQDDNDWSAGLRLHKVIDRVSAVAAIEAVVEEGEATPTAGPDSHYERFLTVREELREEQQRVPTFDPARPVVDNPRTRPPEGSHRGAVITDPLALALSELFNAFYTTMVLMLVQFYVFAEETPVQRRGLQASIRQSMSGIVRPLAELLTTLPAGPEFPDRTAGPGFELYSPPMLPRDTTTAWTVMTERLFHAADACLELSRQDGAPPRLALLHENMVILARNVDRLMPNRSQA